MDVPRVVHPQAVADQDIPLRRVGRKRVRALSGEGEPSIEELCKDRGAWVGMGPKVKGHMERDLETRYRRR